MFGAIVFQTQQFHCLWQRDYPPGKAVAELQPEVNELWAERIRQAIEAARLLHQEAIVGTPRAESDDSWFSYPFKQPGHHCAETSCPINILLLDSGKPRTVLAKFWVAFGADEALELTILVQSITQQFHTAEFNDFRLTSPLSPRPAGGFKVNNKVVG